MNKTVMGAILLFFLVVAGAVAVKFLLPLFEEEQQKATSDATRTKGKIRVAMDNWIGYFPLRSPEMKARMRKAGYQLVTEDDNADYRQRMARLKKNDIDLAVATVDSFLLNGAIYNFPGAIILVIDESKGGDAILARKSKVQSLDHLKGQTNLKVAYTPDSPSHYLAKAAVDHFNVPELLPAGSHRIETDGSVKAREKLLSGTADIAICWEPDVSKALSNPEIVKILGTEDTERLIVDILIAGRELVEEQPQIIQLLLDTYFRVLKHYRDKPALLQEHVSKETGLGKEAVNNMLKGVKWANFSDNCEKWFGISAPGSYAEEGLVDTITSTTRILINSGDFKQDPVPDEDPYRITNSAFLETLFARGISGFTASKVTAMNTPGTGTLATFFTPLDDNQWNSLREVGTLKIDPIVFQHGATTLDRLAKQVVDQAVERLKHYPNFRILIKGHTGTRGDINENLRLSQERAESVARYLKVVYSVNQNRINAQGFGGTKPLKRQQGESRRAWSYRLPRVELVLAREDY